VKRPEKSLSGFPESTIVAVLIYQVSKDLRWSSPSTLSMTGQRRVAVVARAMSAVASSPSVESFGIIWLFIEHYNMSG